MLATDALGTAHDRERRVRETGQDVFLSAVDNLSVI